MKNGSRKTSVSNKEGEHGRQVVRLYEARWHQAQSNNPQNDGAYSGRM